MDLKYELGAYFPESFPRRRGDGPTAHTPPETLHIVSPAGAGMDLKYELRACVSGVVTQDVREEPVIEFAADRIVGQTGDALAQRRVSGGAAFWRGVSLLLRESVDVEDRPRLEPFVGSCVTPEVGGWRGQVAAAGQEECW